MRSFIDTNIFVYATYDTFKEHAAAIGFLKKLRKGPDVSVISWGVVYEYLRVVTHPRIFPKGALSFDKAIENFQKFRQSPYVEVVQESPDHLEFLKATVKDAGKSRGNILHDCHIVALMQEHEIRRIYTADVDFRLFKKLEVVNPLK